MEAFEVVLATYLDEAALDLQSDNLPTVYRYYNPMSLSIEYKDKTWQCKARYLAETGELVTIFKDYSPELVAELALYYEKNYAANNE